MVSSIIRVEGGRWKLAKHVKSHLVFLPVCVLCVRDWMSVCVCECVCVCKHTLIVIPHLFSDGPESPLQHVQGHLHPDGYKHKHKRPQVRPTEQQPLPDLTLSGSACYSPERTEETTAGQEIDQAFGSPRLLGAEPLVSPTGCMLIPPEQTQRACDTGERCLGGGGLCKHTLAFREDLLATAGQ